MSSVSTSSSSAITSVVLRRVSSRTGVALVTGMIFTLAGTAVHVALDREHTGYAEDRVTLAAWSRALARAEAEARIDPARVAQLRPAALASVPPTNTCSVAQASPSPVVDIARHASQRVATRATADAFNAALIANFLRTPPSHRRPRSAGRTHAVTRIALDITQLDVAGIADGSAADGVDKKPALAAPVAAATASRGGNAPRLTTNAWGFDSGIGQVSTGARAGTLNGAPAAALDVGLTENGVRFDAAGMSEVSSFDPGTLRHGFKATTGASIPLE